MKARSTGAFLLLALGVLIALGLLLSRSAACEAVYPVERAKSLFMRHVFSRAVGLFRGAEAEAENIRLRREIAALSLLGGEVDRLDAENERLRKVLSYARRTGGEWIAAPVLSQGGGAAPAHNILRIGKGSLDGLVEGAAVVVPEGLVGRVAALSPHTAEVRLLTDPSVKVSCEIETGEAQMPSGILSGGTRDALLLKHVVTLGDIPPRARVVTSGLGGVFPRGLSVGTFLSGERVLPAVDPATLEDVFVRREKK